MAKYIVEMQMDKQEKFYFIRENESGDIVYLPSKYLMHKKRSKIYRIPYKEVPLHYLII